MNSAAYEQLNSLMDRAADNLVNRSLPNTGRMAGAALAAGAIPGLVSMVDDQETNVFGTAASGLIGGGGIALGGMIGYGNSHLGDDAKEAFIRQETNKLKVQAQQNRAVSGPTAAADDFGYAKTRLLESVEPISPREGKVLGKRSDAAKILNMTPREIRGMSKGAMLGAIASALPAYLAMRNGDVEQ